MEAYFCPHGVVGEASSSWGTDWVVRCPFVTHIVLPLCLWGAVLGGGRKMSTASARRCFGFSARKKARKENEKKNSLGVSPPFYLDEFVHYPYLWCHDRQHPTEFVL